MSEPIKPNETLLVEVGMIANGRLIHDRNAWTYNYKYWCQEGHKDMVEKFEKKLRELVVRSKQL